MGASRCRLEATYPAIPTEAHYHTGLDTSFTSSNLQTTWIKIVSLLQTPWQAGLLGISNGVPWLFAGKTPDLIGLTVC